MPNYFPGVASLHSDPANMSITTEETMATHINNHPTIFFLITRHLAAALRVPDSGCLPDLCWLAGVLTIS